MFAVLPATRPWICKYLSSFTDSPKGAGGESSSLDEDSSDALSPDQLTNHDSPLSAVPQLSPSDALTQNGDMSPPQVPSQDVTQIKSFESRELNINKTGDDNHDHGIHLSNVFSVHHAVPSPATSTTSSPSEWVRLLPIPKSDKWDDSDLGELPRLYWTGQGMKMLILLLLCHKPWKISVSSWTSSRFDNIWINLTLISICGAAITG